MERASMICLRSLRSCFVSTLQRSAKMSSTSLPVITADQWWSQHKRVKILDGEMSYYDSDPNQEKSNRVAIFLHGNPTSSYLWRNIMPRIEGTARCLAPDLIGMGRSSKIPNIMYTYKDHYDYLCVWFDSMNLPDKVTIVCHDWGAALGLNWAYKNSQLIEALVYFEGLLEVFESISNLPGDAPHMLGSFRSEAGEEMVLKQNLFVERMLPAFIMRQLDPTEMEAYRDSFKEEGESRRATLTWPREIPFRDTGPKHLVDTIDAYAKWLSESTDVPKLFIDGYPGLLSEIHRATTKDWPNQKTLKTKGIHFLQEDSPHEIGDGINDFMLKI